MAQVLEPNRLEHTQAAPATAGFPGRWVSGSCMIAAPIVLVIGTLVGAGVYRARGADYMEAMGAHAAQASLSFEFAVGGMMLLILAVVGLAQMVAAAKPGSVHFGGVLTLLGLLGPLFFNGVYFAGFQLAGGADWAAGATAIDQAQIIPSNIINIAGPALVIGFIALAIEARKAGVLGRVAAWALALTCIIPAGFISGYLLIATLGFVGAAIALVPLGVRTLQAR